MVSCRDHHHWPLMQTHSRCSISTSDMWQTQLQGLLPVCFQELKSLASQPEAWKFDNLVFIFCDNISWTRLHVFQSFTWLKEAAFKTVIQLLLPFMVAVIRLENFSKMWQSNLRFCLFLNFDSCLKSHDQTCHVKKGWGGKPQDLAQLHESHLGVVLKTFRCLLYPKHRAPQQIWSLALGVCLVSHNWLSPAHTSF